jgi:hypothetical protein
LRKYPLLSSLRLMQSPVPCIYWYEVLVSYHPRPFSICRATSVAHRKPPPSSKPVVVGKSVLPFQSLEFSSPKCHRKLLFKGSCSVVELICVLYCYPKVFSHKQVWLIVFTNQGEGITRPEVRRVPSCDSAYCTGPMLVFRELTKWNPGPI